LTPWLLVVLSARYNFTYTAIGGTRRNRNLDLPLPHLLAMTDNNHEINMASVVSRSSIRVVQSWLAVEQPQQRLPVELIALISSFLVDTSSLRSLAKVNQVSHAVQEETIKLNQTWVYKSVPAWLQTVGHGIPKGWAHAR
jgi:hypothetical protein